MIDGGPVAVGLMLALVAIGGAIGSVARVWIGTQVQRGVVRSVVWGEWLPWGTFFVNISGAFAVGIFAGIGLVQHTGVWALLSIGIIGSYTTVSALALQTLEMAARGHPVRAGLNIALSVGVGLIAVAFGFACAKALMMSAP